MEDNRNKTNRESEILHIFPEYMRTLFSMVAGKYSLLQEIRLRVNRTVIIVLQNREWFLNKDGELQKEQNGECYVIGEQEISDVLNHICSYSLYAFEDEIRQGFVTIPGGHRVGVAGQVVLEQEQSVRYIKNIRYMNIRISHQIKGLANKVLPFLYGEERLYNTLIISPPGCGKTTLLRDLIRQISDGNKWGKGKTVGVVDERSEIAGSYRGTPQNDVGLRTDVVEGCPKIIGMRMLLRSMAPQVMAVDELGSEQEITLLRQITYCGSSIIATIHGENVQDIRNKAYLKKAIEEEILKWYLVLKKEGPKCVVTGIFDERMIPCYEL